MGIPDLVTYDVIYEHELAHLPDVFPLTSFKHLIASTSLFMQFPSDQIRFLICLVSFLFLGGLFRFIPGKTLKNIYCLSLGLFGTWTVMGPTSLNLFMSSMFTYLFVEIFMPRSPQWKKEGEAGFDAEKQLLEKKDLYGRRQLIGRLIFLFSMLFICGAHIYRYINDYLGYRLDFTAGQMLLTIKISAYAWNRVDGETLADGLPLNDIPREEQYRKDRAIRGRPSLLQYLAWVYHFTSCLAGPSIDYREYEMFLDGTLWQQYGLKECPSTILPTLTKLFYVCCAYPGLYMLSLFPLGKYVGSDKFFQDYPDTAHQILYVLAFNGFSRYKYYVAWYLAEAASVSTGIGISGYDSKTEVVEWNRCNGSRGWIIESAITVSDLATSWNIRCSEWLKHYVFLRATLPESLKGKISERTFADLCTKFTSAFWHGVYPGYYMFFLQVPLLQAFIDGFNKMAHPIFFEENPENPRKPILLYPRGWIYNLLANILTLYSFHWLGASFVLLEFTPTWRIMCSTYFWYHIAGYLSLILLPSILCKRKRGENKDVAASIPAPTVGTDKQKVIKRD